MTGDRDRAADGDGTGGGDRTSGGPRRNGHGMGERQYGSGISGRRPVRPDDRATGGRADGAALEALFTAALREGTVDAEGERRAVAAFRAARDEGAHRARTRRRDDWRPRQRRAARSLRTTLSVFLASLTLGGIAVAAIGSAGPSSRAAGDDRDRVHASASAGAEPGGRPSATASAPTDRPVTAKDIEAHCRAYEHVRGRGKALDATVWQRLVTAAGGAADVDAYCARQSARAATAGSKPRESKEPKVPKGSTGSKESQGTGRSGQSTKGDGAAGENQGQAGKAEGKDD